MGKINEMEYKTIVIISDRIAKDYYNLKRSRQIELENNYNIDSGTDYARYILNEVVYDKDGASIY